jgi:hypothetical protein
MSRETVKRSELASWTGYGCCAAHSRWYWGLKLYLITTPDGDARGLVPGQPEDRRTRGRRRIAGLRRPRRDGRAQVRPVQIRVQSGNWRRTVPARHPQIRFIRGARTAVRRIAVPAAWKTASNGR